MDTDTVTLETAQFLTETLVTDTLCWEVIARTPKTMTIRRTMNDPNSGPVRDTRVDGGTDPQAMPVMWEAQVPNPNGAVVTVRLRKDGTFRTGRSANPLRPTANPQRRIDYRF